MDGLMLHGGAKACTLEALRITPTPEPTGTHTPIPHAEMVDTVKKFAQVEGLSILDESYGVQAGKDKDTGETLPAARMFGLMTIGLAGDEKRIIPDLPGAHVAPELQEREYAVMLGLRNSHDKSFAWGLTLGSRVFVCDNLCFSGEITINRKHTGGIRESVIPALMQGFARLPEIEAGQALRLQRYKALEMEQSYANDYFVRVAAAGVIAPNRILAAVNEYARPQHPEFESRTLWSAFNSVTETMKGTTRVEKVKGEDVTRHGVGGVNIFDMPAKGRALHAVSDWYARDILGDKETPEPDAETLAWIAKSETRALALN